MPTHYEYALIANEAYQDNPAGGNPPTDWKVVETYYPKNEHGFAAAAYHNDKTKEIIIAFRGTQPTGDIDTFHNIFTDMLLLAGAILFKDRQQKPNCFGFAKNFVQGVKNKHGIHHKISYTGHSLGAVYAEIFACIDKTEAVTFESPGSKSIVDNMDECTGYNSAQITEYLSAPNAVNTLNPHVGTINRVVIDHVEGLRLGFIGQCLLGTASRGLTFFTLGSSSAFTKAAIGLACTATVSDVIANNWLENKEVKSFFSSISNLTSGVSAILFAGIAVKEVCSIANGAYKFFSLSSSEVSILKQLSAKELESIKQLDAKSFDFIKKAQNVDSNTLGVIVEKERWIKNLKEYGELLKENAEINRLRYGDIFPRPSNLHQLQEKYAQNKVMIKLFDELSFMKRDQVELLYSINSNNLKNLQGFKDLTELNTTIQKFECATLLTNFTNLSKKIFDQRIAAQIIPSITWLAKQHRLIHMLPHFNAKTGAIKPERIKRMEQWPNHLGGRGMVGITKDVAHSIIPFSPKNPGLHTLVFSDENNIIEYQIRNITDYKESSPKKAPIHAYGKLPALQNN